MWRPPHSGVQVQVVTAVVALSLASGDVVFTRLPRPRRMVAMRTSERVSIDLVMTLVVVTRTPRKRRVGEAGSFRCSFL
jgi:hypothetical protein